MLLGMDRHICITHVVIVVLTIGHALLTAGAMFLRGRRQRHDGT